MSGQSVTMMLEPAGLTTAEYAYHLCRELNATRWGPVLLATNQRFDAEGWGTDVRVHPVYTNHRTRIGILRVHQYFSSFGRVAHLIARQSPKIVHVQWFKSPLFELPLLLAICRIKHASLVYTAHNILPHEKDSRDYYIFQSVYKGVDSVIVHSEGLRTQLVDIFPEATSKTFVCHHGTLGYVRERFDYDRTEARHKLGVSEGSFVYLAFGLIRPYKGLDLLLEAFGQLPKEQKAVLVIVGQSFAGYNLDRELSNAVDNLDSNKRILRINKYITNDEIPLYFRACDCVVLPYREIYGSGVLMLAFAYGKPVIATKTGFFSEMVLEKQSGVCVPVTADALREAMGEFADRRNWWRAQGNSISQYYDTKYSWRNVAQETSQVYTRAWASKEINDSR